VTNFGTVPPRSSASHGLTVLIVEDDDDQAFLVREAMSGIGFTTAIVVATAQAALEQLRADTCDLVILDLGLPDADGLSILGLMRHGDQLGIPVLVVTGDADPERRVRALELGAEDLVVKPFNLLELGARARRALRMHDDLEAAGVVARTLARELTELTETVDEQTSMVIATLLVALEARLPHIYARGVRVGDFVERLAVALELPELAAQLGKAARAHEVGVLAMSDADVAALEHGDPLVGAECERASLLLLGDRDQVTAAASRFRRPANDFVRHIDRLAARMTSVCHIFDVAAVAHGTFDPERGADALRAEDALGLDADLIETFVDQCVPTLHPHTF
jgi:DNA-binding response OmpR family regulator